MNRVSDERLKELAKWVPGGKTSLLSATCEEWQAMSVELQQARRDLTDRDNHIDCTYAALGDVNRNIHLFDHVRKLKDELRLQKGANHAQDERECDAAERLGMVHCCDWPDQVADTVASLRVFKAETDGKLADLDLQLREMTVDRNLWKDAHDEDCPNKGMLETAEADLESLLSKLKDSTAVHSNILRGTIALTKEQAIHVAGLPANIEKQLEELRAGHTRLLDALQRADNFISNGIEMGYIRMPEGDCPDPAKETPGIVRAALAEAAIVGK